MLPIPADRGNRRNSSEIRWLRLHGIAGDRVPKTVPRARAVPKTIQEHLSAARRRQLRNDVPDDDRLASAARQHKQVHEGAYEYQ